jgi:tetratricopeptide (TPR) repeat protein
LGKSTEVQDALRPQINRSVLWRTQWMRLASEQVAAPTAASWLEAVAQHIPVGAIDEKIRLAQAWQSLAERSHNPQHVTLTQQRVTQLCKEVDGRADVPADLLQWLAVFGQTHGDLPTAQRLYRRALQVDPRLAVSMNNLAALLADQGGDLAEAQALAAAAIESSPDTAAFYDTLGHINAKRRQFGPAAQSLNKAVELQPGNCAYRVRLAGALLEAGQQDKARQMLSSTDTLRPEGMPLPDREQLQALRTRLAVRSTP